MDISEVVLSVAGAAITAGVPVVVAFAVAYGRRALEALETSKYADAYSKLDPLVREAIETAAAQALTRAADEATKFGRDDVKPWIAAHADEATAALSQATGVRVKLQPAHVNALVELAASEVKTALAEIDEAYPPLDHESGGAHSGGAAYLERPNVDESGVPYLIRPTTTETVKWSDTSAGDPFPYAGQSGVGPAVAFPAGYTSDEPEHRATPDPFGAPSDEEAARIDRRHDGCKYTEDDA